MGVQRDGPASYCRVWCKFNLPIVNFSDVSRFFWEEINHSILGKKFLEISFLAS